MALYTCKLALVANWVYDEKHLKYGVTVRFLCVTGALCTTTSEALNAIGHLLPLYILSTQTADATASCLW